MANQIISKRKIQQATTGYGIFLFLLIAVGGYFGYVNYSEYQSSQSAIENEQAQLSQLKGSADKAKKDFFALQTDLDTKNSGVKQSIEKILPSTEDFTNLARELDDYFRQTRPTENPMFLSDIRFNQPRVDKDRDYGTLPFSMTMSGNEDGFKQFLAQIEKSGELTNDSTSQSRLMDVSNINLAFVNENKSDSSTSAAASNTSNSSASTSTTGNEALAALNMVRSINVSMNLKAYFQKPLDDSTIK